MYELMIKMNFDAAHKLCGYRGNCANVHGHTWIVEVTVAGSKLNSLGLLIDFKELKKIVGRIIEQLDHSYLNELPAFAHGGEMSNPTAENLSCYIYKKVKAELNSNYPEVKLSRVNVWESPTSCASYWEE
ncbi:MAG: 6-carboxytetrahydropterin synthase QueD [Desulfotomaculum sp.]|nr:6-carboxytetrahydropterin synthase QueD [Desulfotomaculum sp.]